MSKFLLLLSSEVVDPDNSSPSNVSTSCNNSTILGVFPLSPTGHISGCNNVPIIGPTSNRSNVVMYAASILVNVS